MGFTTNMKGSNVYAHNSLKLRPASFHVRIKISKLCIFDLKNAQTNPKSAIFTISFIHD